MSSGMKDWKYYNHAMIPTTPPHETPDTSCIENGEIWKHPRKPFLVRWISDFDCEEKTNWWYVIKDTPFDINSLKSKRRYEINKGLRFFEVKEIDPKQFKPEIYSIQLASYATYDEAYRPSVEKEKLFSEIDNWSFYKVVGAFHKETSELCGYAILERSGDYVSYAVHKVDPAYEKYAINAAIVHHIVTSHRSFLLNGGYLCDGSRNINHHTFFQDYLEKYFGFRKAYCQLRVKYRRDIELIVYILYPFRKLLKMFDKIRIIHLINSILMMEEIARNNDIL